LDFLGDGDGDLGGVDEGSFTDNGEEGQETNKPRKVGRENRRLENRCCFVKPDEYEIGRERQIGELGTMVAGDVFTGLIRR